MGLIARLPCLGQTKIECAASSSSPSTPSPISPSSRTPGFSRCRRNSCIPWRNSGATGEADPRPHNAARKPEYNASKQKPLLFPASPQNRCAAPALRQLTMSFSSFSSSSLSPSSSSQAPGFSRCRRNSCAQWRNSGAIGETDPCPHNVVQKPGLRC